MILITQIVMAASVILLLLFDLIAYLKGGLDATISFQIVDLSRKQKWGLLIPFAIGFLCGHFFWQMF